MNWLQVLGHVNSKHPNTTNNDEFNKTQLHNEIKHNTDNDTIDPNQELLDMEIKYGRVCIIYHNDINNTDTWHKKIHCAKLNCAHEQFYMENMKTHLNWHNDIKKHYDIACPYCPELFAHLGTLNRHVHGIRTYRQTKGKHCPGINYNNPNWVDIWRDICIKNSPQ